MSGRPWVASESDLARTHIRPEHLRCSREGFSIAISLAQIAMNRVLPKYRLTEQEFVAIEKEGNAAGWKG